MEMTAPFTVLPWGHENKPVPVKLSLGGKTWKKMKRRVQSSGSQEGMNEARYLYFKYGQREPNPQHYCHRHYHVCIISLQLHKRPLRIKAVYMTALGRAEWISPWYWEKSTCFIFLSSTYLFQKFSMGSGYKQGSLVSHIQTRLRRAWLGESSIYTQQRKIENEFECSQEE